MLRNSSQEIASLSRPFPSIVGNARSSCGAFVLAAREQVDAGSLAVFRILFGLIGLFIVARFFAHGWIDELYIVPEYHFTYMWFGWVRPWPGWGMYAHFAALGFVALGITVGYRYRLCALLFFLDFTYVELLDKTAYLNHYYWAALVSLLMVFIPMHHSLSIDSWRRNGILWGAVPAGAIWLLRAQLAAVYVFAGIAKLNNDWLLEAQPLRIWLKDHIALPTVGPLLGEAWTAYAFSWSGALFDLTIVGWLMWRRTRPAAYVVLVVFHLMTYLLFPQIGVFPWLMAGAALIFFPSDWPKRLVSGVRVERLRSLAGSPKAPGWKHVPPAGAVVQKSSESLRPKILIEVAAVAGVILFVAVQVAMPLRHYAYPGNVRWNEEGYRFAWRVLLTEKVGLVEYRVYEPESGQRWRVGPEDYLTPLQAERMTTQPDMILATAHIIARDFAARGRPNVEVRADVFVSINGRENARLVDPEADLAAVSHGVGPKPWLLPEP